MLTIRNRAPTFIADSPLHGRGLFMANSVCNHSETPNAIFEVDAENACVVLKANSSIKSGGEILISYGEFIDEALKG